MTNQGMIVERSGKGGRGAVGPESRIVPAIAGRRSHMSIRKGAWMGMALLMSIGGAACEEQAPASGHVETPSTPAEKDGPPAAGPIPEGWVAERMAEAEKRLGQSEGGRIVWDAIEAHGGLGPWLEAGTVAFEFDYQPLGEPARRMHTENRVDLWRSRAWQKELGEGADATLGFDGKTAWIVPGPDAFPAPARFWATTPYYFVGIPWVLADPGTRFDRLDDTELNGETYRLVKVSYEQDTGDTPDDYYIVYVHPESKRVDAIRYVVSYPAFFPDGGHSPEKLMRYLDHRQVGGLRVAHRYETYAFDVASGERGEKVTEVDVRRVRFGERWPADLFAPPEGAHIDESQGS